MQSQVEPLHTNRIITNRPDSSLLVDLHVYIIPKKVWKNRQNLAENETIEQAISAGFVRIPEGLTIHDLRRYIIDICGEDINFPKEFLYLRSVGRCLTKVKDSQEKELKVKNYRPPLTIAPEIFILEQHHDDNSSSINQQIMTPQSWIRPIEGSSLAYPLFDHYSTSTPPTPLVKLSPRNLSKLRAEQERLSLRQIELAEKRHEVEEEHNKQEEAAIKIQTAFRDYRDRQSIKQQQQHEADDIEIKHLQNEARELTRRKAETQHAEERHLHAVVRLSHRLEDLRAKRIELEANRNQVVRQMQQLQTQITIQRREEKDLWKQKYLIEKNQITACEEQSRTLSKNSTDIHTQLEQAKLRLNNTTKLRRQSEYESRLLRQELQQISSTLNIIERHRLPKESQQQEETEPISLDITLRY